MDLSDKNSIHGSLSTHAFEFEIEIRGLGMELRKRFGLVMLGNKAYVVAVGVRRRALSGYSGKW